MNVFVLGFSGHGKSPFARKFSEATGFTRVKASGWVSKLVDQEFATREERTAVLTKKSMEVLKQDPRYSLRYLLGMVHDQCVIDGIRNPLDFISLFDPRQDVAIWLDHVMTLRQPTSFEDAGIATINQYAGFLKTNGLMEPWRFKHVYFEYFWTKDKHPNACPNTTSLEEEIEDYIQWFTTTSLLSTR